MKVVPDISMRAALKNKKARENAMFSLAFLVRWLQLGYFYYVSYQKPTVNPAE